MKRLDVQDIYWPDHPTNLKLKVVPPEPLQRITEDWGARDANWFFDFPTSAKTVLSFLEASKIYAEPGTKFEGVIGLNINVLGTILEFVGPIPVPEYNLTIDSSNFLYELQREVETGRDHKPGSNPKKILSVLAPLLLQRLQELPTGERRLLLERIEEHFAVKDIMIFARDTQIANLLQTFHLDGRIHDLPHNFWGSYLAVVNANIASGKSDVFIDQTIEGRVDVDTKGATFTQLSITRSHRGDKEKDPWWRTDNKNFIQILTEPVALLVSIEGNTPRTSTTTVDYKALGYEVNPDLAALETTKIFLTTEHACIMQSFKKKVFAAWFITPAGKTNTLHLKYQTPSKNEIGSGKVYQFIFERQSGVKSKIRVVLNAPVGYTWLESGSPAYVYESDNPDGKVIVNLMLRKQ
jgi:hypothetical protein